MQDNHFRQFFDLYSFALMFSFFLRLRNVLGWISSNSAAPPLPSIWRLCKKRASRLSFFSLKSIMPFLCHLAFFKALQKSKKDGQTGILSLSLTAGSRLRLRLAYLGGASQVFDEPLGAVSRIPPLQNPYITKDRVFNTVFCYIRTDRDSNPGYAINVYTISSRAP